MQFPCPVCQRSFDDYDSLLPHYESCFETQERFLSTRRVAEVKDTILTLKFMWDEISAEYLRKKQEEELNLQFLKDSGAGQIECSLCHHKKFFREVETVPCCSSQHCHDCLLSYILSEIRTGNLTDFKCRNCPRPPPLPPDAPPPCTHDLTPTLISTLLGPIRYDKLEADRLDFFMRSHPELFVFCPNEECGKGFERVMQTESEIRGRLGSGSDVSESDIHKEQYRFACRSCRTEFCSGCNAMPYHDGHTCDSYKRHIVSERCRWCDEPVVNVNPRDPPALKSICSQLECQKKKKLACVRTLRCGHQCFGIRGEKSCLPCLHRDCAGSSNDGGSGGGSRRRRRSRRGQPKLEQTGDDYCNICFVEGLESAPNIQLACGHVFHYQCIVDKITTAWAGPAITWSFLNCPLCKVLISHPPRSSPLREVLRPFVELRALVKKMALRRLRHEGLDRDDSIVKRGGRFYRDPAGFAEAKLAYYQCFQCQRPYFGGMKSCEDAGADRDFKKEDLVCGACAAKTLSFTKTCGEHGPDFIEWKCKFCCNASSFFCWGSTHFCDSCHKIQCQTQRLTKTPVSELPKCKGGRRCPSGGDHPPNGTECALGCSICRRNLEF